MKKSITSSSKYTIFDFSNAFVSRNTSKAIQVLESLKVEGTPETLIIWALTRELNNLFKVSKYKAEKFELLINSAITAANNKTKPKRRQKCQKIVFT